MNDPARLAHDDRSDQYLTFLLADEEYGLEILDVQEIKSWGPITPLPRTPDHVLGVMNLRGAIVPLIDLRRCFGLPVVPHDAATAVIIVNAGEQGPVRKLGLVVDRVSEVYRLDIEPAPAMTGTGTSEGRFVAGFGRVDEQLIIVLDLKVVVQASLQSSTEAVELEPLG